MAINASEAVRNSISYTLATDRNSLIRLLERNGVQVPQNPSDNEVVALVLISSAKSPNFKSELSKLLTGKLQQSASDYAEFVGGQSDFGFTGIDDFSFVGEEDFFSQTAEPSAKKVRKAAQQQKKITAAKAGEKTGFGKFLQNLGASLSSPETINSGLNIGLTAVNNRIQTRSNAVQQETAAITQKSDEIKNELAQKKGGRGMGTGTIVLIGVGVLALVGIIYFVAKKK
jgi:hypothetical protein